jgi:dTDP-4-dehydrorhamnose reductase
VKILVFGQTGQVARELARRVPAGMALTCLSRDQADLSDPAACAGIVAGSDADVILNAAAWTAVDLAETQEQAATVINGDAPAAMAQAAGQRPFLHISTDYVFDGTGDAPFAPNDSVAPLGAYGRSKLAGEIGIRAAGGRHVILRTSWVVSAHGNNFVKTMLRLGATRDSLNVVADQIGGPTPAAAIADALFVIAAKMQAGAKGGTYHFAGNPAVSWADFARAIMAGAGLNCAVTDIPSRDYPTPAKRPQNSRLDCASLGRDFGIIPPDWQAGLRHILSELEGGL